MVRARSTRSGVTTADQENIGRTANVTEGASAEQAPGKLSPSAAAVLKVLDDCQRAPAMSGSKGFAAALGRCASSQDGDFLSTLIDALDRVLLIGKKENGVEKLISLFKQSCSTCADKKKRRSKKSKRESEDSVSSDKSTVSSNNGNDAEVGVSIAEEQCYIGNDNLEHILEHLLKRLVAEDKSVRLRSAQLIGEILKVIPGDGAFLADSLWAGLEKGLLARLGDKAPAVRARAAAALERLQDPDLCVAGRDPICNALAELLTLDTSAEVRRAALRSVVVSKETLAAVVARTHDAKEEVRECAFEQLGDRVHLRSLSIAQRNQLLRDGLKDRAKGVRDAAAKMLCGHWLSLAGNGDPLALLRHLDAEAFEDTALLALRAIFARAEQGKKSSGRREDALSKSERDLLDKATTFDFSNETGDVVLSPEGSLFLFARCEALVARGAHDQVEDLVSDLSSLCAVASASLEKCLAAFAQESDEESAVALRANQFALEHLLRTAALLDSRHDVVGQQVATSMVKRVLACRAVVNDKALAAAFGLLRGFYLANSGATSFSNKARSRGYGCSAADEESFIRQGADIVFDCLDPLENEDLESEEAAQAREAELAARQAAAEALAQRIKECVATEDYAGAAELKAELKALDELPEEAVLEWRMERALLLTEALLAAVRRPVLVAEAASLLDRVVVPNLQSDVVERRHGAVKCLALYCHLSADEARRNLQVFLMVIETAEEEPYVRCDALKSIFDLVLLWGMAALVRAETKKSEDAGEQEQQHLDEELRDDLMFKLLEFMDNEDKTLRLAAAEGFAKLAVVGRLVDARVLQCLVVLYFHPSSESDVRLRQCLAVCFPTLAENTTSGRQAIEEMVAPLLESLVQPEQGSPLEEISVEAALQYVVYLLSFSKPNVHFEVAECILAELTVDPANANARSLARALCALKVEDCTPPLLKLLDSYSKELAPSIADGVTKRQFEKWEKLLQAYLAKCQGESLDFETVLEDFQGEPTIGDRVKSFGERVDQRNTQLLDQRDQGESAESASAEEQVSRGKQKRKARKLQKNKTQWDSDETSSSEMSNVGDSDEPSDCDSD